MRVVVVVLLCCLLAGCSSGAGTPDAGRSDGTAGATPAGTRSASAVPGPRGRRVRLPDLTAVEFRSARERLTADGLTVRADVVRDCRLSKGLVIAQDPSPGTAVRPGEPVTLTFGRTPPAATCARRPAPAAARALLAWAKGDGPAPALAPRVRLLQGNRQVATLSAARAQDRGAWVLPAGYAEMSATNLLDWMDGQVLLQPSRGLPAYCLQVAAPPPADLVDRLWWSSALLTASADACLQMAAVQVWVGDDARIAAVGFLSGSP